MKATELRIGNWVRADGYYPYADIDGITKDFVNIGHESYAYEAIEPIPITEWLNKFGKYEDYYQGYVVEMKLLSGREARLILNSSGYVILHDGRKNIFIGVVEFIHLFQNLFFALSGEELKLKE